MNADVLRSSLKYVYYLTNIAGLRIVANVAIATGPALMGVPRSFVVNLFFVICVGGCYTSCTRGKLSEKGPYILILHMLYSTETLFAECKHGRPQGGKTGICSPWKLGLRAKNF